MDSEMNRIATALERIADALEGRQLSLPAATSAPVEEKKTVKTKEEKKAEVTKTEKAEVKEEAKVEDAKPEVKVDIVAVRALGAKLIAAGLSAGMKPILTKYVKEGSKPILSEVPEDKLANVLAEYTTLAAANKVA